MFFLWVALKMVFFFFFFGYKDECQYKNMSNTDNCLFLSSPKLQPKSIHISGCKFIIYFAQKKLLFLFYTLIFIKHPHQFIYSTHLFNKIFILLQFFIIPSLTTPLSHRPTVHYYQRSLHTQPPSSPSSQHHHHPTSIIKENQSTKSQTHSSPTQLETPSSQIITHPT